jgi:NAD(P)-dependent dehydrogenase (short-subunit alcohol dehydrogenase family)
LPVTPGKDRLRPLGFGRTNTGAPWNSVMAIAPSLFATGITQLIPEEMAAQLTRDAAFPKRMGRPEEYARLAQAIFETPMLNGGTIRLDGGQRFAPR